MQPTNAEIIAAKNTTPGAVPSAIFPQRLFPPPNKSPTASPRRMDQSQPCHRGKKQKTNAPLHSRNLKKRACRSHENDRHTMNSHIPFLPDTGQDPFKSISKTL